ncbi:MAG: CDP-alcohol phosphatidyltransferase family protein [Alphaproteobacteria bacterium]|nr:CDP-alcohol phosphatidyltransferase family protein [Alphaproteobacteria bacterium]
MYIPNFITIGRILLVPVMIWLLISGAYPEALAVFAVAALSDAVDGWLARKLQARTELGSYLDPLADKTMLVSTYATLGATRAMPAWLVILVISRDVLIIGGLMLAWLLDKPVNVKPLFVSKVNTLAQIFYMVLLLGQLSFDFLPGRLFDVAGLAVAALTIASGIAYLRAWVMHMNGAMSP